MVLKTKGLVKKYRDTLALNDVNIQLEHGIYALLGANGAGKTTLMKLLCMLAEPTEGNIFCDGIPIGSLGEKYRGRLGYLPQDFGCYPMFTVREYLMYIALIKGITKNGAVERTEQMLEMVALSHVKNKKMSALSGGMKRRVGIAQAMINDPELLIMDEPTTGLDPGERIRFKGFIGELAKEKIIFISTHIVSDVESFSKKIFIMKKGGMIAEGDLKTLKKPVQGRVWEMILQPEELSFLKENYLVSEVSDLGGQYKVRLIVDAAPNERAELKPVSLEDAFLYYTGERGERNASL